MSSEGRFQFNRQLWNRFIEIAQPYFYPIIPGGTRTFFGLLVMTLVSVVAFTFFLTVALTFAGQAIFPAFFSELAAQLVERIGQLLSSPAPMVAIATLLISGLIIFYLRTPLQERWKQWSLLACLLFLSFAVNGMNVAISYVFRYLENALNQKEEAVFWQFLWVYAGIIILAIPVIIIYRYIRLKLALYWREWLTKLFFNRYFSNRSYYELDSNAANTEIDNPDQRITEDIRSFTETTLRFILDILDSILTLLSFTMVLYTISKALTLGLVIYATLGTSIAVFVGQRLIKVNYNQLRLEANFRYGMVHVRNHAESIAFYRGEKLEQKQVSNRFIEALKNANLLIIWQSIIDLFQVGYNYFPRILPYAIVAPLYFLGETDFGTIGQASFAFFQVLGALSLITNRIEDISKFSASIVRLGTFYEKISAPDEPTNSPANRQANSPADSPANRQADRQTDRQADRQTEPQTNANVRPLKPSHIELIEGSHLAIQHLTLHTPNMEQTLFKNISLDIIPDEHLLIVGASGCGKSSLLRAIAGLWTNGQGTIERPDISNTFFLPQRPYMLLGTLRDQVVYPNLYSTVSDDDIHQVLDQVNLSKLADRVGGLNVECDWSTTLSLGEQQRLAFARILLTQPKYAILDEATSALDIHNERMLYELLQDLGVMYVSVGHRASLLDYHHKVLDLGDASTGWSFTNSDHYKFASA